MSMWVVCGWCVGGVWVGVGGCVGGVWVWVGVLCGCVFYRATCSFVGYLLRIK